MCLLLAGLVHWCVITVVYGAGDLDGVSYLLKYTTLEHMQADQVAKLPSDIIHRRLVEVRELLLRRVTASAPFSMAWLSVGGHLVHWLCLAPLPLSQPTLAFVNVVERRGSFQA